MSSRQIVSRSPGMLPSSPLLRLPDELIALVASRFRADCSAGEADKALHSLASVNQRLYNIVNPILWQRVSFNFCDEVPQESLVGLNRMASAVADLSVSIAGTASFVGDATPQLASTLRGCRNLVTLCFKLGESRYMKTFYDGPYGAERVDKVLVEPLLAVFRAIGSQLRTLEMCLDWNGVTIGRIVPVFLKHTPNLAALSFHLKGLEFAEASFPALPLLERLHLQSPSILLHTISPSLLPGLTDLTLNDLDKDELLIVHRHFGAQLRSLALGCVGISIEDDIALEFPRLLRLENLDAGPYSSFFLAFRPDPKTPLHTLVLQELADYDLPGIQAFVDGQTRQTLRNLVIKSNGLSGIAHRSTTDCHIEYGSDDDNDSLEDERSARTQLMRDCLKWARLYGIDVEADWYREEALGGDDEDHTT